jgi:hypothetical protein
MVRSSSSVYGSISGAWANQRPVMAPGWRSKYLHERSNMPENDNPDVASRIRATLADDQDPNK